MCPVPDRTLPPGYPLTWEADVVLRDGTVAHMRPITPADADGVRAFHAQQSPESIYLRFFAPVREASDEAVRRTTEVDYVNQGVIVVTVRDQPVGYARFERTGEHTAEVAFNIADSHHGKGIGSILLEHLAAIGLELGYTTFVADVLAENSKMLGVFQAAGYDLDYDLEHGYVTVSFAIAPTAESTAVRQSREHRAESLSVRSILSPRAVAVVGASRRDNTVGHTFLAALTASGYRGPLYAVNPHASEVLGVACYPTIADVPGQLDLVVVAIPAGQVVDLVDACAAKGARTLLVASGNFAESGAEGRELQEQLRRRALAAGMRVVGPVSFGLIHNSATQPLNASLATEVPPRGNLGLFAESGTLAIAVLASLARRNLGLSVFASAGNRVDVSSNDLMQFWIDDRNTEVVGLYLESLGNPRKFSRIARNLSLIKPVVVVKSGVSQFRGFPGSIVRPPAQPEAFDAMLRQAGVIRAQDIHELFDIAQFIAHQPLPRGNRVAIVVNTHPLASITADAALAAGLEVTHGPVALGVEARAEEFAAALAAAFEDDHVDSVVAAFIPAIYTEGADVVEVMREVVARYDKPCAATLLGVHGMAESLTIESAQGGHRRVVPAYAMPEDAVRALARVTGYTEWKSSEHGAPVAPEGIDRDGVAELIDGVLEQTPAGRRLTQQETRTLLGAYGIEVWPHEIVSTPDEAEAAAERLGYPMVLQAMSAHARRRRVPTGLRPDLDSAAEVREAFASLTRRIGALPDDRIVAQRMSPPGTGCLIGSTEDPVFGPVVSFCETSLAGEPPRDIGYRVPPLTDLDVRELILSTRIGLVLSNPGGREPIHMDPLRSIVARLSVLADDHPDLSLVVLNPVNCWGLGVDVLGAVVVVAPSAIRADADRRVMS